MKFSELNYDKVCSMLNKKSFCMHSDESDCMRDVRHENDFEDVRKKITDKYGDVEISVNPGTDWWDEVKIEDEKWNEDYDAFCKDKQAWCDKYGCD